jgi:hypothetical protein
MLEIVLREDHQRPLCAQTTVEQGLTEPARPVQHVGEGDGLPCSRRIAAGQERAIRGLARPVHKPLGEVDRVVAERLGAAHQQRTVRSLVDRNCGALARAGAVLHFAVVYEHHSLRSARGHGQDQDE